MKKYSRTQIYTKEEGEDNDVLAANIRIRTSLFVCTHFGLRRIQEHKYTQKKEKTMMCLQRIFVLGRRCSCVRVLDEEVFKNTNIHKRRRRRQLCACSEYSY